MARYKQKIIPEVTTPAEWKTLKASELRRAVYDYLMAHHNGKDVVNEDLQIVIHIRRKAIQKTAFGEAMYSKKAAAALVLPQLLKYAQYNNWGDPKPQDPKSLIGYFNFKAKCKIDGNIENLRIAVKLYEDGRFYYNIEVNKKE